MRALVTGCAGFIGSHLADYLLHLGYEVAGVDSLIRGDLNHVNPDVEFHTGDIRDPDIGRLMQGIDWVFHTAAVSTTPWAVKDPIETNSINVSGTLNLLESARKHEVQRFLFSSSNIVYAAPTAYKVSKLAAEGYCATYSHLYGLSTLSMRYSNVYGSLRQNEENCIMSMRASALKNGYVSITGDGRQSRDFTHVNDICRANAMAAMSGLTGELDICTGVNHTMNDVTRLLGYKVQYVGERPGDIKHIRQDPMAAQEKLGWSPEISFADGIEVYR